MKKYLAMMVLAMLPVAGSAAIVYDGTLEQGSTGNGSLEADFGWSESSGGEVDFWKFSGEAGDVINIFAGSNDTDVAFSLFSGSGDMYSSPFYYSSNSDWDFLPSTGSYNFTHLASVTTVGDEELLGFELPETGIFTLAVGGEIARYLSGGYGNYGYSVRLEKAAAAVPEPGSLGILVAGLTGLVARRAMARRIAPTA